MTLPGYLLVRHVTVFGG